MKTKQLWTMTAASLAMLLITADPALAQTDASRIDELEARTAQLTAELTALRAQFGK